MDNERKQDIKLAYLILCRYNLWRKGFCESHPAIKDISFAISTACGALIDFSGMQKEYEITRKSLAICEKELEEMFNKENVWHDRLIKQIELRTAAEDEVKRLRGLLAANKIKYAKKK